MTKNGGSIKKRMSAWRRFLSIMLWAFTAISALGLIAGSFGGNINPATVKGICLMVMTLPGWILLLLIATVLDIIWCRKAIILSILTFIACAAAIWEYCPLNVSRPSIADYEQDPKFTFLTYNVANLNDMTDTYPGDTNPIISYILKTGADVVNLQECLLLSVHGRLHITQEQIDSLHQAYPYIIMYGYSNALLSKYPAESIHLGGINKPGNEIAAFRLNIEGTQVTLFDVHLQSYDLTVEDKALYHDITDLKDPEGAKSIKSSVKEVKSQLLSKIQAAAVQRANDCERLCRYIEHYGGPNVIIAGDFNDVPGCYSLRRLADFKFRQVYPELGFGPMITFNRDRFYFRIDHILYRGDLKPLRLARGSVKWSDHYPLHATFAITSAK